VARGQRKKDISVDSYEHTGKKRKNNPQVGLVSSSTDKLNGKTKYKHDPHIDPFLSWAGKAEGMNFEVQNVSLHIHERIDPKRIVKNFIKPKKGDKVQHLLFAFALYIPRIYFSVRFNKSKNFTLTSIPLFIYIIIENENRFLKKITSDG